jgi:hypothetical protein
MAGLADSIRDTIISIQGSDTGTLNPVGQRDFLQAQFDAAIASGDFQQANQIASQLAQAIRRVGASGTDADSRIDALLDDLRMAEDQAAQAQPPTSSQISDFSSRVNEDSARQIELASQMLEKIGVLSDITSETPFEIAERLGVPMEELIGTMLDVEQFGIDQVEQLGMIASQLGVGLDELGRSIGVNIGTLDQTTSLLNDALESAIGELPPEIAGPLEEALRDVEDTGDVSGLEELVGDLAPKFRDQLAPFFEGIDETNFLSDQLDAQREIERWTRAGAEASESVRVLMEQVNQNMQAQNENMGIPSYQTGTSFVPNDGPAFLHRGEAVLTAEENRERGGNDRSTVSAIRAMQKELAARMDRQEREMRRRNEILEREERRRRTTI